VAQPVPFTPSIAISANSHSIEQLCRLIINQLPEAQPGVQADELFKQLEVYLAQSAVERTKGNKQAAANLLGIYRPRLYSLLKKGAEQNESAAPVADGKGLESLPPEVSERANAAVPI
jgi:DNA-binding NtrC family response regulator